jgi:DNA-binding NtrC family response regulator
VSAVAGRVLVVEDDDAMRALLAEEIAGAGHAVATSPGGARALEHLDSHPADVVVTDLEMPGMRGSEVLARIRARDPDLPVVIITAFGSIESAVEAVKAGAFHYVAKPFRMDQLVATIEHALRERRLRLENAALRRSAAGATPLVAASPSMQAVIDIIGRAAAVDSPVLLLGESGTGKELLARALHDRGPRRPGPFLALNCSAIPETLLESQLFGHRRGAFTDAREDRRGLFQEADGGTMFLDEIGDMALPLQAKLLRVLEERAIRPLGAEASVRVDVRVVAATHRDLEAHIKAERFRQDLFFRLAVITVRVPPLRERPEDLVPLVTALLEKHRRRLGRAACTVSPAALERLRGHRWPGNVRELENALERALVLGRDDVIGPLDLPEIPEAATTATAVPDRAPAPDGTRGAGVGPGSDRPLGDIERDHILSTLRGVRGNKTAAARILGVDRKTLYRKLRGYGVDPAG